MMLPRELEARAEARAQQNRLNASHSTGPVTAAGKQAVSLNSTKHNLTSSGKDRAALAGEESAFEQFCRELHAELAPVGPIEGALADDICGDRWRLRRARRMENALFAKIESERDPRVDSATAQAEAFIDAQKGLQRISLYANRLQRAITRNTAALETKQAQRKAAAAKAREEAILLTQYAELEGKPYDPGQDFSPAAEYGGFIYSGDEIAAAVDRARRLDEAKTLFPPQSKAAA